MVEAANSTDGVFDGSDTHLHEGVDGNMGTEIWEWELRVTCSTNVGIVWQDTPPAAKSRNRPSINSSIVFFWMSLDSNLQVAYNSLELFL